MSNACSTRWVEYRNLSTVLAHEGPLPHVEQDRPAVGNATDRERSKKMKEAAN